MALHANAKAETGYRFYALYDKISREDILAHAYAQCRSNKGAPGVDDQDFADIEAYGVKRWLGELALALRPVSYTHLDVYKRQPFDKHRAEETVEDHALRRAFASNRRLLTRRVKGGIRKFVRHAPDNAVILAKYKPANCCL